MRDGDKLYIVTKHHNAMACIVGKPTASLVIAQKLQRSLRKGQFKPKAVARIWKLVDEREMP